MNAEEAYQEYRKEYRKDWYQRNKTKQDYLKWVRNNPHLQHVPDLFELYKEHGGAKAKRIVMERLLEG